MRALLLMSIFFLSHENPVPSYSNVFFDFFCGNISKHNRDREINPQYFKGFIILEVASQSISEGTDRVVKALALPHSSFTISHKSAVCKTGLHYGFYTCSSPSAYGF